MAGDQFRRLVANLKVDGVLTTTPLVYEGVVLSGNHRVQAAIAAGIEEANVIEILEKPTPARLRALQLSHNALVGQDDPGVLGQLYAGLDLTWKQYSGLTDAVINTAGKFDVGALAIGAPKYQELTLLFLPQFADNFNKALADIDKRLKRGVSVLTARMEDFDLFFNTVIAVKKQRGIHNSGLAVLAMAEIAAKALAEELPDKKGDGDGAGAAALAVADEAEEDGPHA